MYTKTITLPGQHDLDIAPIQLIVDSKSFQKLRKKKQLGISNLVFPFANHTRFEHSLGTYSLTLERTARLRERGVITEHEAHNVCLYGLLHDIAHGAFSHDLETLCTKDHNEHGVNVIRRMRRQIESCGGDFDLVEALFMRRHPLACCVSHKQLGAEKFDYVIRDARHTLENVALRVGDLLNHTTIMNGQLVADVRILTEVEQAISSYVTMYDRVYFRKSCQNAKRFFQKIVAQAMSYGELQEEHIWQLNDEELNAILFRSGVAKVRELFLRLDERRWPKTAILLKLEGSHSPDRLDGKSIAVRSVTIDALRSFARFRRPQDASDLERTLARMAGIPEESILVVPAVSSSRFEPEDVPICDGNKIIGSLKGMRPAFYHHIGEVKDSQAAVRVCVFEEYRERVSSPRVAGKIFEYLLSAVH